MKKGVIIRRSLFFVFLILSVLLGNVAARIQILAETSLNLIDKTEKLNLSDSGIDESKLMQDDNVINILLIGADKRADWTEAGRSDSMMIATLDGKHKRLKVTSLMRDLYVEIPGHGLDRLNAAYAYGGVDLLYSTLAQNFNIKLDGYILVDFKAFKSVVNTIGGVNIEITDWEYNYLIKKYPTGSIQKLKPGMNLMNGTQALAYSRIRQDRSADFGRTARQRKVIQSVFTEVKEMPLSDVYMLINDVLPYVATDQTNEEITDLVKTVLTMGTTELDQFRIPVNGTYTDETVYQGGTKMQVLVPDLYANRNDLEDFIYNYDGGDAEYMP
ncbi:MAG: LCP family protein [Clostridiales bacterium]|nr:LCP family protein [Clostridiales bacterium]